MFREFSELDVQGLRVEGVRVQGLGCRARGCTAGYGLLRSGAARFGFSLGIPVNRHVRLGA